MDAFGTSNRNLQRAAVIMFGPQWRAMRPLNGNYTFAENMATGEQRMMRMDEVTDVIFGTAASLFSSERAS